MDFAVLLYIIRRVHAEQLVELFPEVFYIPYANSVCGFLDTVAGINKKLCGLSEADGPDKNIYRLAGD
jgi:hypothetical protein